MSIRYSHEMVEALEQTRTPEVSVSKNMRQIIHEYLMVTNLEYAMKHENSYSVAAQIATDRARRAEIASARAQIAAARARAANIAAQRPNWTTRQEKHSLSPMMCYKIDGSKCFCLGS